MSPWEWHLCVETCSSVYIFIYMLQIVYHSTYCGWCVDCSLTLNPGTLATVSFYLPLVNICPQLYMMSPLLCHLVLSTVHCSAALCVCYMWQCVMWRVYWLCCVETGQMWISVSWAFCGFFKQHLLGHCCGQTKDTVTYSYQCHNDSPLYCVHTGWWIHCTMNCPDQCSNHSTTVTLTALISMLSNWTVQCVPLDNRA